MYMYWRDFSFFNSVEIAEDIRDEGSREGSGEDIGDDVIQGITIGESAASQTAKNNQPAKKRRQTKRK